MLDEYVGGDGYTSLNFRVHWGRKETKIEISNIP